METSRVLIPTRVDLLGVPVSAINIAQALAVIDGWITAQDPHYICVTPVHSVMDCVSSRDLLMIFESAGLVTPDGMPLVWWLRWHGQTHVERVYGPDLLLAVCQRSLETGWSHYFYGGAPGVPEELSARLQARFPGLKVAGIYSPPYRPLTPAEDEEVCQRIQASQADILWVGLGSPRQEYWMSAHVGKVGSPVLVGVGAAFDFHSGRKRQAPRWIQHSGLEWLFRLVNEPGRLWQRYLLGYPRFVVLAAWQLLRERLKPPAGRAK